MSYPSRFKDTPEHQDYSDKETVSSLTTQDDSLPEVAEIQNKAPSVIQYCDICIGWLHNPATFIQEIPASHSRGRFDTALCKNHLEEAQYFEVVNRTSGSNCRQCARQLREHTQLQRMGCWIYQKYQDCHIVARNYLPGADVNWPSENTHQRHLTGRYG